MFRSYGIKTNVCVHTPYHIKSSTDRKLDYSLSCKEEENLYWHVGLHVYLCYKRLPEVGITVPGHVELIYVMNGVS
jgi:hypothetical protein